MIGQSFGHYQIVEKIGAGGMGVVYRATDSRLGRDVALKLLPDAFARDAERMARFQREARLLASLNHTNIATIYGLEESGEARAIAMELAEGPSLADRLQSGPIPIDEALAIAKQVAEALEAAHEKGIIHRDLKPANVKVTPDGKVKVLDFGLAKALAGDAGEAVASPTISEVATRDGVILGTAAYMSPEQARGKPLDRRTDIWSFGCLLYEMLTGRMAFGGDTVSDSLVRILGSEPDWEALPAETPANVRAVLARCLRKDAARRLRDIADARMELEEPAARGTPTETDMERGAHRRQAWRQPLPVALAAVILILTAALVWSLVRTLPMAGTAATVARLSVLLPPGRQLVNGPLAIAISPDGRDLVMVVEEERGRPGPIDNMWLLYRRPLSDLAATPIQGTEMGSAPFFSPDGEWLGFHSPDGLKKISMRGGAPILIPGAGSGGAGTWLSDNHIVYTTGRDLFHLPADGGQPGTLLTWTQLQKGEVLIESPSALQGRPAFLVEFLGYDPARSAIAVWSGGTFTRVASGGLAPKYLETGHLLYRRQTKVGGNRYDAYAAPFDLSGPRVTGKEVPVLEDIRYGQLAVSATGTLAYNSSGTENAIQQLIWIDQSGATELIEERQGAFFLSPRVSPDGTRLLYSVGPNNSDIHMFVRNLKSGASHMIGGATYWACWTPDSQRIAYIRMNPERTAGNLFWQAADGTGPADRLTRGDRHQQPLFVTPDGSTLVFNEHSPDTGYDLWQLSLRGDRTPGPLLQTKANERLASIERDGKYMAYVSDQSGRDEVWVSPFPGGEGAQQVSTEGGTAPLWAPDRNSLYYRDAAATRLFAVPVTWQPAPAFGSPTVISGWWSEDLPWGRQYDITPDGKRFVMSTGTSTAGNEITVVLNWFEELKRKLQAK